MLRPGHSGTSSALLIVFGPFIYWVCRYFSSTQGNGHVNVSIDCIFDKIKTFLLQVMFIIAWGNISVLEIFQKDVLYKLSSIFITAAFLRLLQSMTHSDIWLCFCKFIMLLSEELITRFFQYGYFFLTHYPRKWHLVCCSLFWFRYLGPESEFSWLSSLEIHWCAKECSQSHC